MATAHTTLTRIAALHYVATAAQVEALAHERYTSNATMLLADNTYLRVIAAGCKAKLGRARTRRGNGADAQAQLTVLEAVHKPFYEAVLRGVTTEDVAPDEAVDDEERARRTRVRNSRSGFARSAKSTLKTFVEAGGDIRTIDVDTVTKAQLRDAFKPAPPTDRVARQIQRAEEALMRALTRQARASPETAQASAEAFIEALQKAVEDLAAEGEDVEPAPPSTPQRPTEAPRARTRAGVPTFRAPSVTT